MNRFTASSNFTHRGPPLTAVLLVQLGTPDDPAPAPVRRYLKQFLWDPRVVEIPRLAWWPILNGIVLTTRPRKSSAKYRVGLDAGRLAAAGPHAAPGVAAAGIARVSAGSTWQWSMPCATATRRLPPVCAQLRERNLTRLLVVPLYPQFAASTTASVFDAIAAELTGWRNLPELRMVRNFHDEPGYIAALAAQVRRHWDG